MLGSQTYLRIVKYSAAYDLIVTAPFATPWTWALLYGALQSIHQWSGLAGDFPPLNHVTVLLANLMGSVVLVWSVLRLHLMLPVFGRYDAVARALFATWQIYAVANGASVILLAFTLVEITFMILQLLPYRQESVPVERSED